MIRKFLLVFLAFLLFLTSFLFVFSLSGYSLFYLEIYVDGLREGGAFEYAESGLKQIPYASFIKIPDGGLEAVVTPLLSNFFSYLRSDTDKLTLEVEIDLPKLRNFFLDSVKSVTVCKPLQKYSFDNLDEICRPFDKNIDVFLDEYLQYKGLNLFSNNVTDLAGVYGIEEGRAGREKLDKIRDYIQYYKIGVFFIGLIFVLLILIIYFVSGNLKSAMRFVGMPVLLCGLLILIVIFLGASALQEFVSAEMSLQFGREIISYLVASAMRPFYQYSICALIVGVCLIVGSFFVKKT